MNILVVGGGGREHAIIKALKKSPDADKIYALPGNGGIAADAQCVPIGAKDIPAIVDFAKNNTIDYAVVAPGRSACARSGRCPRRGGDSFVRSDRGGCADRRLQGVRKGAYEEIFDPDGIL